ncbi:hypothetical protein FHX36_001554 [Modestobacter versicolor]|nr:hypothetical protein [Modestobacter versicolor]
MSLAEKLFEGSGFTYSHKTRYIATWAAMAPSSFVVVAAWFVPVESPPAGNWAISLIGVAVLAFCIYANRYFRWRLDHERSQTAPH